MDPPNGGRERSQTEVQLSEEWGEIDNLLQDLVSGVPEYVATGDAEAADPYTAWLTQYQMECYKDLLIKSGFDDLKFLSEDIMTETDLRRSGIRSQDDCSTLVAVASLLPDRSAICEPDTVPELLQDLGLEEYLELFAQNDYMTVKKVCSLWDNELFGMGMAKLGHRRRLTAAIRELHMLNPMLHGDVKLPEMSDIELALRMRRLSMSRLIQLSKESSAPTMPETNVRRDFSTVQASMKRKPIEKADVPHIKVDTNESRGGANPNDPNFDSSRPQTDRDLDPLNLRSPRHAQEHNIKILQKMGIESTHLKKMGDSWKHQVTEVAKGNLHYDVQYLGTELVKKFEGPKTTEEACHKMQMMAMKMQKIPKISLWIHGSIIKFVDSKSQSVIQKDELKTVLYIAQDVKDPTVFGYVTRDPLQKKLCFCHVLRAETKKIANEIVMTLGQAFEIAYQHHKKTKAIQKMAAFEEDLEQRRGSKHGDSLDLAAGSTAQPVAASHTAPAPPPHAAAATPAAASVGSRGAEKESPAYSKVIPKRLRKQVSPDKAKTSSTDGPVRLIDSPHMVPARSSIKHEVSLKESEKEGEEETHWVTPGSTASNGPRS
ncbi:ankyrin repeat and SAM domain-containing protein 1A-like [Sycon ciliatum]|uniref:ankyrin repeat and SAM domain-containing protein 1A-like n=1 Tax=Sycon ciliatum TaxID=27933 RepID=UPI0020AB65C9|eukprot:scpid46611/ scgid24790/ Ankyrin repeat and SAM domain-containing protein 1A; Odin